MRATIDFVEVSGGATDAFLVHVTAKQPHVATVRHYGDRVQAEKDRELLGGPYGYVIGSPSELAASQLPTLVLLLAHRAMAPLERFTTRKKIERKVWNLMSEMTAEEKKAAAEQEKAAKKQAADQKKADAEAKKAAAAQKKQEAEAAKKSKADAAAAKKQEAEQAKAAKKQAAEAKKAETAEAKQARELAKSRINPNETVTVLVDKNPKREGSEAHKRFALYTNGMTVKAFLDAGGTMADVNWDLGHRLISLTAPVAATGGEQAAS